jgi:hypothetical protein
MSMTGAWQPLEQCERIEVFVIVQGQAGRV